MSLRFLVVFLLSFLLAFGLIGVGVELTTFWGLIILWAVGIQGVSIFITRRLTKNLPIQKKHPTGYFKGDFFKTVSDLSGSLIICSIILVATFLAEGFFDPKETVGTVFILGMTGMTLWLLYLKLTDKR